MRNTRTSMARRTALVAATVTAGLVLAACGGSSDSDSGGHDGHTSGSSSSSPSSSTAAHNAQDMSFAQGMIPHHQQALEMAKLAAGRASSAKVKDLATRIEKAQDPEIRTMSDWLKSWGQTVPSAMVARIRRASVPLTSVAKGDSRTFPNDNQRDIGHGVTDPSGSTATTSFAHRPHSSATFGVRPAAPRPKYLSRSTTTRVTPSSRSASRAPATR